MFFTSYIIKIMMRDILNNYFPWSCNFFLEQAKGLSESKKFESLKTYPYCLPHSVIWLLEMSLYVFEL